jgi:hypothetical protein
LSNLAIDEILSLVHGIDPNVSSLSIPWREKEKRRILTGTVSGKALEVNLFSLE